MQGRIKACDCKEHENFDEELKYLPNIDSIEMHLANIMLERVPLVFQKEKDIK